MCSQLMLIKWERNLSLHSFIGVSLILTLPGLNKAWTYPYYYMYYPVINVMERNHERNMRISENIFTAGFLAKIGHSS